MGFGSETPPAESGYSLLCGVKERKGGGSENQRVLALIALVTKVARQVRIPEVHLTVNEPSTASMRTRPRAVFDGESTDAADRFSDCVEPAIRE